MGWLSRFDFFKVSDLWTERVRDSVYLTCLCCEVSKAPRIPSYFYL